MNKERHVYYQEPEQKRKMKTAMQLANCTSESDFVRTAIDFYTGYLLQNESLDYLSPVISLVVHDTLQAIHAQRQSFPQLGRTQGGCAYRVCHHVQGGGCAARRCAV